MINLISNILLAIRKQISATINHNLAKRQHIVLNVSMNLTSFVFDKTKFECKTILWVRFPRAKIEIK